MNIALMGYGKMGRAIEQVLLQHGHRITCLFHSQHPPKRELIAACDVVIEVSRPELAVSHIQLCLEAGVPVVVGTTGWYNALDEVKQMVEEKGGTLLYATNFSVGVNILFHLNEMLAQLTTAYPQYRPKLEEIHHTAKLDSPSGTGITLAEGILKFHEEKKSWVNHPSENPEELALTSVRKENIPGTHIVTYVSDVDTLEIKHEAHNRLGFAEGAALAATWIVGKQGVFTMRDLLKFN